MAAEAWAGDAGMRPGCYSVLRAVAAASSPPSPSTGAASGSQRVIRGGSWDSNASYCSVSDRYYFVPGGRYKNIGFRVLCPSSAQQ